MSEIEEKEVIVMVENTHYTWKCYLFGKESAMVLSVKKPPNFFWRWMQYLCFGNRWEKIKEANDE
jgi:hypothetical protein